MKKKKLAVSEVQVRLLNSANLELHPEHPLINVQIEDEERAFLTEELKHDSPVNAVRVYQKEGEESFIPLEQVNKVKVACELATDIWCQIVKDVNDDNAYSWIYRLSESADKWTMYDKAIYCSGYLDGKSDIDGAMAAFARETGCTRANVTHMHQVGTVAKYLKSLLSPVNYSLLRSKGTHLRHIHGAGEDNWLTLCLKMLEEGWSSRKTEEAVKELLIKAKTPAVVNTPALVPPSADPELSSDKESESEPAVEEESETYVPEPEPEATPPTYSDTMSHLHDDVDQLQIALVYFAQEIRSNWKSLSEPDQESVKASAMKIFDSLAQIVTYFPFDWLTSVPLPANNETADENNAVQESLI